MSRRSSRTVRIAVALAAALGVAAAAIPGRAGPELVAFPADYRSQFVAVGTVDRPDRSPPQVRHFYINRAALEAARPGQPFPNGTVLIMEDRRAQLGPDGQPMRDAEGRFLSSDQVVALFVQEKRTGWGTEYPDNIRNGEWEYAAFAADGTRRDAPTTGCFQCHRTRARQDYSFLVWHYIRDQRR
jgi:hypothetical protein